MKLKMVVSIVKIEENMANSIVGRRIRSLASEQG